MSGKRPYLTHPATSGTVRFLHGWSGPILSEIEAVVTVFGQAYPGVTVESESVASADLLDTLVTALASGAPPNAVMLRSDSTPYFADAGALAPLDTLLKRDGIRSSWFRARELSARTWEGQLYGLPHVSVGAEQLLYVNLALVERLGGDPAAPLATWTQALELVESARRLGAIILDPTRCGAGVLGLPVWTHTVGGRWIDDAGRTALWSEPSAVMAAEWMHQLVTAQRRDTVLPAVGARGAGPVSVAEWTQQLHVCAVNGAGWRARLVKEAPQLRIGVFGLPGADSVPADQRRTPSYGGWMLAIPRESRDQGAAWEWIKHLGVGDAADRLAKQQGRPSTLETGPSADRRGTPVDPVVEAAQASSVISPALPISARLDDLAADAQARLLTQRESPRAILEAAAQAGQQLLDAWHAGRRRTR